MKLVILLLVSVTILSSNLFSQAIPMQISYQGVLKDAAGNVLNGDFTITFRIYNDAVGGSALWNENQSVSVANGLFNIQLGSVTPITTVPFDRIQFLGITVGTGSELSPRTLLSPTPYSFMSMDILDNAITTNKLQNGAVTVDKIAPGITDGQVLTTVSGNVLWQTSTSGVFTLPYSGNVSSTSPAFALTNVGTGPALYGLNNNSAALFGQTIGGVGVVGQSSTGIAVGGETASGIGVQGKHSGIGNLGELGTYVAGVHAVAYGNARGVFAQATSGTGVHGESFGGYGIYGESSSNDGVFGQHSTSGNFGRLGSSTEGVFGKHNSSGNWGQLGTGLDGVRGFSTSATGVHGTITSGSGSGVYGENTNTGNNGYLGGTAGVYGYGSSGAAVYSEGDLVVTGAYRGNIGSNNGAPFPRPAYNSGWIAMGQVDRRVLNHGLGGNPDDYFVYMCFKTAPPPAGLGIHQVYYGQEIVWRELTNSSIAVERHANSSGTQDIRVQIWVIR